MMPFPTRKPWMPVLLLAMGLTLFARVLPAAELQVESSQFVPDREFPRLLPYILDGWDLKHGMAPEKPYTSIVPVGASILLTVRNTGTQPVDAEHVFLNGIDLSRQIVMNGRSHRGLNAASYLLNDPQTTPSSVKNQLEALGQPVWYQVRPDPIPPGGFAQLTVRLRRIPNMQDFELRLGGGKGDSVSVRISPQHPSALAIASVCFSDSIDRAFVYLRSRTNEDFELASITFDGRPVNLSPDQPRKSAHGFLSLSIALNPPWEYGSFHHVAVNTKAGETAAAVVRARDAFFALGMWGYRNHGNSKIERARDTATAYSDHGFNVHMGMAGGQMGALDSDEGHTMLEKLSLRLMVSDPTKKDIGWPGLYARFLMDEPDAHEYAVKDLPGDRRLGAYAQGLVEKQRRWTARDPRTLDLLNVNLTYKPENWITYGHLPDILACDPYYQMRLLDTYWKHPGWLGRNCTPYYVFAVADVARWAAEPNPLHIILNSVSVHDGDKVFRYGTPEEKRIEFYYAIAAGAKGISYWWFTPYGEYKGCGSDEPGARAMMKEMARLNVEARALGPLLADAYPAAESGVNFDPFVTARPPWLMTRTLFIGPDTMLVVLVNRDHASDRIGTVFEPIPKGILTIDTPAWMKIADSFRLTRDGIKPLTLDMTKTGTEAVLKEIRLTEIVVLTANPDLRGAVERRWNTAWSKFVKGTSAESK